MFNIQEASGGRLNKRGHDRPEDADFASRTAVFRPVYPGPGGRPVGKTAIRHQRMVSEQQPGPHANTN
jgi:hypothetical protein